MANLYRYWILLLLAAPGALLASDRLKVLTTFTVIADMAQNVAGDAAEVVSLTKPGAEIHNYQPTPKDIVRARDADLVLWNGLGLELWFEKFLSRLKNVPSVVLTHGIEPVDIRLGPYSGRPNPHAWMSPTDALTYIQNIEKALSSADPANAATYQQNAAAYAVQITKLIEPIRAQLETIPQDKRWLVTSEGAFSYLTRDFGLNELFLWPINADEQGTPKQVKNVIDQIRTHGITAIFSESTVSSKPAEQVARETGANYAGILYVDSLSAADGPVPSYIDLLRVTTETILNGLLL